MLKSTRFQAVFLMALGTLLGYMVATGQLAALAKLWAGPPANSTAEAPTGARRAGIETAATRGIGSPNPALSVQGERC